MTGGQGLLCASPFQHHLKVESDIWDLEAKLGLFWDHFGTLVPFGTKSQIWDLIRGANFRQICSFLSDPGKPGVRSLGPDVRNKQTNKLLDVCKT